MTLGRLLRWLGAMLIGVAVGAVGVLAFQQQAAPAPLPPVTVVTSTTETSPLTTSPAPAPTLFVVWTPGGLPEGLAATVGALAGVATVSEVRSDLVLVEAVYDSSGAAVKTTPSGWFLPLEAAAIDGTFADLAPAPWQGVLADLAQGETVLGTTSAEIRGIGIGATFVTNNGEVRVVAVVPDEVVGATELMVSQEDVLGVSTPRYLLLSHLGDRAQFEQSVRELVGPNQPVRIRALGETPFLRHGDAVLPQVLIKETFGEFMVRSLSGDGDAFDPEWAEAFIETATYPLIGTAACHNSVVPALQGAMAELERNNLGFLIETFDGCFNPRFIAGSQALSRHAWGVAIDLNYQANPTGQVTVQDPRLVETMERWGFGWGGNWLVPDAAHFEWLRPVAPRRRSARSVEDLAGDVGQLPNLGSRELGEESPLQAGEVSFLDRLELLQTARGDRDHHATSVLGRGRSRYEAAAGEIGHQP